MTAKAVEIAASEGCPEKMMVARSHVHPGFTGSDYDIGILELAEPSKVSRQTHLFTHTTVSHHPPIHLNPPHTRTRTLTLASVYVHV